MLNDRLLTCMIALSWRIPLLVVFAFCMVSYLINRRQYPIFRVASMSMGVFILWTVFLPVINLFVFQTRSESGSEVCTEPMIRAVLAEYSLILLTIAFCMLLSSLFPSRLILLSESAPRFATVVASICFAVGLSVLRCYAALTATSTSQNCSLPVESTGTLLENLSRAVPVMAFCIVGIVIASANLKHHWQSYVLVQLGLATLVFLEIALPLTLMLLRSQQFEQESCLVAAMIYILGQATAFGMLNKAIVLRSTPNYKEVGHCNGRYSEAVSRGTVGGVALVLYGLALASPAVYIDRVAAGPIDRLYSGIECLCAFPIVFYYAAWWANVVFGAGVLCLIAGYRRVAGICGLIALLLSLSYCVQIYNDSGRGDALKVGYWLWVASSATIASLIVRCTASLFVGDAADEHDGPPQGGRG